MNDDPLEALADALPGRFITVFKFDTGSKKGQYGVMYKDLEIWDGGAYIGNCGSGRTIREAADDYINHITEKELIWHAGTDEEQKIKVVILRQTKYLYI